MVPPGGQSKTVNKLISDPPHPEKKLPRLCWEYLCLRFTRVLIILFGVGAYEEIPAPALIAKTQEVWGRRLKRPVSAEEAREIIRSFSNFLALLKEVRHNGKQ